ncbi:unnamed protein product, partial [Leptidea sinapis]
AAQNSGDIYIEVSYDSNWGILRASSRLEVYYEKQRYDGWFNNRAYPEWGSAGQVVTGEIVMASESGCPIEQHRIPVDKCDHMYDPDCDGVKYMPFHRAAYDRATGQSPNSPREQNIILYEYVPSFLGTPVPPYQGYRAEMAPGITHAFAVAAFRFGHTLDVMSQVPIEEVLMGMVSQLSEREDALLCSDVRDNLFVKTFNEINPRLFEENPDLLQKLVQVYEGKLDNIDVYIGNIFTREEIAELRRITLWDVIVNSTAIGPGDIQRDVLHWREGDPCPQPYQLNATKLPPCKYLKGYDYFEGNEFAYIYTCLILVFVPILCAGAGYGVVKLQNSRRRKLKLQQENLKNAQCKGSVDKMVCREWVHASHKRLVKLRLGPEPALHVTDRKGDKLRTVPLEHTDQFTVIESQETRSNKRPLVLIRVPREHDLVLEMDSVASRRKFLLKLDTFLAQHKKALNLTQSIVMRTSLSKSEFASALGMKSDAVFVKKMFNIVDKDGDGRISFQEFLDTVVLFSRGATDDKLRIIFDMCDNDRNGVIDKEELSEMLRSLVEIARTTSLRDEHVTELIDGMFSDAGLQLKDHLTYSDFKLMMKEYKGEFVAIGLDCKGAKQNFLDTSTNVARMTSFHIEPHWFILKWDYLTTFLEENRQNIFYLFIFYVVTIGLFVERFAHYSFMSEHLDLRHIMGVGIAITRGSAASLSFCYSLLLLTMSRNLLTKLKEFSIQQYIPLDSSIQFHKIVACTALFFSLLHTAGHMVNFYHVSTQPIENLKCLTKEVVSLRTEYLALDVLETEMLPSDVIKIKFYRPPNLKYLSGQWVRLSCTAFKKEEYHSFTLTSAPHENFLSCHIKAQGPWTWKLRNYFDPCNYNPDNRPKIRIQGPFGGGNQDWYKFEVAVMVGGGIGVTPYASILNDLVFGTSTNRYSGVACKKVYFLWICPSHKHFEWFIDVLRDVERKDYICENHFQRLSRTSMFTGLKAVNHFGRPDMSSFLKFVQKKHSYVSKIGVFSCGPRPLTKSIMSACEQVNRTRRLPYFIHHFENFG